MSLMKVIYYRLKTSWIWLQRLGHCRGFGIQSPSDYWFVRYVINEHWPYYLYETLGRDDDSLQRKIGKLYFRISNWRQPTIIDSSSFREYLQAGCKKARFGTSNELIVFSPDRDSHARLSSIFERATNDTVLIINNINQANSLWQGIIADKRTSITFDLYYCGIVFFDKKRHKMNYIINF